MMNFTTKLSKNAPFSNYLRQTFSFFRLSVFRKSTPTYVGRIQGPRGYLAVGGRDFCGEILRACRLIFRAQSIDEEIERAPDNVTEQNGEDGDIANGEKQKE